MVSLFIIALITTSGGAIMLRMADSRDYLKELSERIDSVHQAHTLMRDDLIQWMPRDFRARDIYDPPARFIGGDGFEPEHLFSLVRDGRINPDMMAPRSGLILVRYFIRDGQLIRVVRPTPDAAVGTEDIEQILVSGIRDYSIEFLNAQYWEPQWLSRAGDPAGMPRAVRFEFTFENGRSYDWYFITPVGSSAG